MVGAKGQNLLETLDNFLANHEGIDKDEKDKAIIKTGVNAN